MDTNLSKLWETVKDRHGRFGVLQTMGSQRVGQDLTTEQQQEHLSRKNTAEATGGGSPQPVDFQALGPIALSSQGKHTHMHTHTHTHTPHTHTHAHTRVPQVGVFIRKPERSTPGSMNCPKS